MLQKLLPKTVHRTAEATEIKLLKIEENVVRTNPVSNLNSRDFEELFIPPDNTKREILNKLRERL